MDSIFLLNQLIKHYYRDIMAMGVNMPVTDKRVYDKISILSEHYKKNINNSFLRKVIANVDLDRTSWDYINDLMNISDYTLAQGYSFADMYDRIIALAKLVKRIREDILPNIKARMSGVNLPHSEKILQEMTVSNFPSNLGIFADKINEVYLMVVELDKAGHKTKKPVYTRIPECSKIGQMLIQ